MYREKTLKEIPQDLRPREKLLKFGPEILVEEELLALILGSGSKDMDVISLSKEVLSIGWEKISKMSVQELQELIKGIGLAKACQIKAVIELSKRINNPLGDVKISSPEDVYKVVKKEVDNRREHLIAMYLSPSNRLLSYEVIAIGRMNSLHADPKDVLYNAVKLACQGIILIHNHPKGELKPSREDIQFTKRLQDACNLLGFDLIDHLIINESGYLSFKAAGLL